MSTDVNKAVVRRFYEQVFNQQRLDLIPDLVTPDYIYHDPESPTLGPEGVQQMAGGFLAALPDLQFAFDDLIGEGDKVVMRFTVRGTHRGEMMGIAATGTAVTIRGIMISRVVEGRIAEEWEAWDALGLTKQLQAAATAAPA